MQSEAKQLNTLEGNVAQKAVLCIGLDEQALEIVKPLVMNSLDLRVLSYIDPVAKIHSEMKTAAIVFLQWDGVGKRAHNILLSCENRRQKDCVPVHLLIRNKLTASPLAPRQAKELGISGWIELPQKYFEIQRLLYDLTGGADQEADDPFANAFAAGPEATPVLLKTQKFRASPTAKTASPFLDEELATPAAEKENLAESSPISNHETPDDKPKGASAKEARTKEAAAKEPVKELKLLVPTGSDLESSARRILGFWKKESAEAAIRAKDLNPFASERLVIVHPDEAFADEIGLLLEQVGVTDIRKTRSVDATMHEIKRGATGLMIWFDNKSRMIYSLLEHLTESRQLTYVPILVMLPSRDVAEELGGKLRGYFFDAICFYDRKMSTMTTAMESMRRAVTVTNTPRSLLEQMRRPLKLESPPEKRRSIPLSELEAMAQKLSERAGKKYWAVSELVPHSVIVGDLNKAMLALKEAVTLRPSAFNSLILRSLVARQTPKKDEATLAFARSVLSYPDLTADRLFRAAQMLDRWKAHEALQILLDGWAAHPELSKDPQLLWMAGRYYLMTKTLNKAHAFMAQAAALEPHRTDYAEGIARILASNNHFDRAASILRYIFGAKDCPWDGRILLPHVLIQSRNMKEAQEVMHQLLAEAPENKELLSIKAKMG